MYGDRFSFRSALAGGLIAALVMVTLPVLGSVGDAIRAGLTTKAGEQTVLKGNVDSQNLKLVNTGNGQAASFVTESGRAPFKVNRAKKVKKLNADKVDGYSATQLAPRAAFIANDDIPDGADYALGTLIEAPAPGILLMSAGVDAYNEDSDIFLRCLLRVDTEYVVGSEMIADIGGSTGTNLEEDCTTSGAVVVGAGDHSVDFEIEDADSNTVFVDASVWVIWVPFNGIGDVPSATAGSTVTP